MIEILLNQLNNYFVKSIISDTFEISGGILIIPEAVNDQYVRIQNSLFNDGVYKYPLTALKDEIFLGCVSLLAVPKAVEDLSKEIDEWCIKYDSPYTSESFGGYSYTKDSNQTSWQKAFASRIRQFKKVVRL